MGRSPTLLLTIALLAVTGCAPKQHPITPAPPMQATMAQGSIMLTMQPTPPRQLDPITFSLQLFNPHKMPLTHAQVLIDLIMPSMNMPKNTILMTEQTSGIYVGRGRFTMAGQWRIGVSIVYDKVGMVHSFPVTVE